MIESPCVKICKYNEDYICIGCFRSAWEIAEWPVMRDEERLKTLKRCYERKEEAQRCMSL